MLRFGKTAEVVRKAVPVGNIVQWGKVERLDGGDRMQASELVKKQKDSRDNTFVQVRFKIAQRKLSCSHSHDLFI